MELHLIDVPEDFYKEKLFFNDPEDLKKIFSRLEEENLAKIHEQQELTQALEILAQREFQSGEELKKEYNEQNKTKMELVAKIDISKSILHSIKLKTMEAMSYKPSTTDSKSV